MHRLKFFFCLGVFATLTSCASSSKIDYSSIPRISTLDYTGLDLWASHPGKEDPGDLVPGSNEYCNNEEADADVFFIHPTTFTGKRSEGQWNADVLNPKINEKTDQSTIRLQASIFNQAGRVFSPRYRQAHISAFYTTDKQKAKEALELAYEDVRAAFLHYLSELNLGRPFVIASHSQGTYHAKRLLAEFVDGQALQDQMIAAYLVGLHVEKDFFKEITPCGSPDETKCFVSWRTYRKNHYPKHYPIGDQYVVTNPLTWTTDDIYAPKSLHKGAVLRNFDKVYEKMIDAQAHNGLLWVSRPKFPWSFLFTRKNYHIADYNFFYLNIQQNVIDRTNRFIADYGGSKP